MKEPILEINIITHKPAGLVVWPMVWMREWVDPFDSSVITFM